MSHEPARTARIAPTPTCRNCGAPISGEYCAACGQETRVQLPTARVFLREAAGRYVALDGRLWRTLATLLFRPGLLTRAYLLGRRRRYIRPARLFLVLSLALFASIRLFGSAPLLLDHEPEVQGSAKPSAKSAPKPAVQFDKGETGGDFQVSDFLLHVDRDLNLNIPNAESRWARELNKRLEHYNRLDRQEKSEQIFLGAARYGPYAMFVLMPAFALLQMVAYFGRSRRYPDRPKRYAEHLVFAANLHAFVFLIAVLAVAIPSDSLQDALMIWCLFYGLWATKVVYRGSWIGLLLRASVVGILYLVLFALAIAGLVLVAIVVR
jgi:hypothetical protein